VSRYATKIEKKKLYDFTVLRGYNLPVSTAEPATKAPELKPDYCKRKRIWERDKVERQAVAKIGVL